MNYREYCTVTDARGTQLDAEGTKDDVLFLRYIREVSKIIDDAAGQFFYPLIQTRSYDTPDSDELVFDRPLLSLTTLTNGDATVVTSAQYFLYPANDTPKYKAKLKGSSGISWQIDSSGDSEQAIDVLAIWGYHSDYSNAWETLDTLAAAITTTTATSLTMTTGTGNVGELWKIDSEYLYLSARTGITATIVRGVNGSTAATHLINAPIYRFVFETEIMGLTRDCVVSKYRNRENPQGEQVVLNGQTFIMPRDIERYIKARLEDFGLVRH